MSREYSLVPRKVPLVSTRYRRILGSIPHPDSVRVIERLQSLEPLAMRGQPPIVWDRAEGFQVYDAFGNCWIDWSSGVLITNAGHGHPALREAIRNQADKCLLTTYCFPSEVRAQLVETLSSMLPDPLKKVFLLTTGSETVECAIKLCREWGVRHPGS
jgi:4-aminobutyrate aminotransferase/diaminobutyrate-pyruvate transaminase/4-aminobutyrate aminotransferase/(S)-3-amino-2-methylpropionate transaminase